MKIKILLFSCLYFIAFIFQVNAQDKFLNGRVTDKSNNWGVPGVNVLIQGTTVGTTTDFDGKYSLNVKEGQTLVFSYIGYKTFKVLIDNQTVLDVSLEVNQEELEEVVVTAFGMERETKALGYSVTEISGEGLQQTRDPNVINSLQGKVAGVQIQKSTGGAGASSRVTIRGNSSLNGSNQPLYVIDGVPVDNSSFYSTTGYWDGGIDYGDGIGDINPDDIASMTVLKGPSAAALYGNRASNGVILITTKTGDSKKGIGVEYNGNVTFEKPLVMPNYQNKYGVGSNGVTPTDNLEQIRGYGGDWNAASWGSEMKGQQFTDWMGETRTLTPQANNMNDFFETGSTITNSLAISGGNETADFRVSYTNLHNSGILPNSTFDRNSLGMRGRVKVTDKLSVDTRMNYYNVKGHNRPTTAETMENPMFAFMNMPRSVRTADLETYQKVNGEHLNWTENLFRQNPYFSMNEAPNHDEKNRFNGFVSAKYEFTDWLSFQARTGLDRFTHEQYRYRPMGAPGTVYDPDGQLAKDMYDVSEWNTDFLFVAKKDINENLSIQGTLGANLLNQQVRHQHTFAGSLVQRGWYSLNNAAEITGRDNFTEKQVNSVFAAANLSYMNMLFFDVTARNDWSSALPGQSFFYPSFTGAFAFSELMDLDGDGFTFGKLRASWAQVGGDTDPYMTQANYTMMTAGTINGRPAIGAGDIGISQWTPYTQLPPLNLLPEMTTSYEFGVDLRFLNNKLGLDFTYYNALSNNQIIPVTLAESSGANSILVNDGSIRNRGIEMQLSATPIQSGNFEWNTIVNFTLNRNTIESLAPDYGLNELEMNRSARSEAVVTAVVGEEYGLIKGNDFVYGDSGYPLMDGNGEFLTEEKSFGSIMPNYMLGWSNTVHYKNFVLNMVIDAQVGGQMFSYTNYYSSANGNHQRTVAERENGIPVENADGSVTNMDAEEYYMKSGGNGARVIAPFVDDVSYIKLRELSLGYSLPKSWVSKASMQDVTVSFVGRNLFYFYNNLDGIDPESLVSRNMLGIEYSSMPSTASYGFNINIKL